MQIITSLIESLKGKDYPVKSVETYVRWTMVVTKHCGLASTMRDNIPHGKREVTDAGKLTEKSTLELAEYAYSDYLLEAVIGCAAINSLIDIDESKCTQLNASRLIENKSKDKTVGIIGHFPFVKKLKEKVRKMYVFEKLPQPGDLTEEDFPEYLPECDILGISATTIINHTLDNILHHSRTDAYKILIGPSSPMSEVVFDFGIDAVAGSLVEDISLVKRYLCEGANFRQLKKNVKILTMLK